MLLFKPYHIPMIRSGEKTVTRRIWKPTYNRPRPGAVHIAAYARPDLDKPAVFTTHEEADCYVRVGEIYDEPLGDMTDEDARKEGDYDTVEEFQAGWERVNGPGSWDPELEVAVVPITYAGRRRPVLAGRTCPECDHGLMVERGDCFVCPMCRYMDVPCSCGGWFSEYRGVNEHGDGVSECPDCGERFYAAARTIVE